ncbi:MAG: ATP-binding cassette domain-containing protein [Lactobacillales bacterium]|jgi:putative ABC transport system ATP-binding protein|nr:ATP-binding cassette domain-containing protein [Lactobacillales bacterium]
MIELKNLCKQYGGKTVFDKVNLNFQTGTSYALIGPSGSGKTTLLNAIARLEKPSSGEILYNGRDIWSKMKEAEYFKNYLGYVFQNYALIDEQTVEQNLKLVGSGKQIREALARVGLDESYLKAKIYELSGGQAQRVAIARILLKNPKVILADEPTGALDEETGETIISLLLSLVSSETTVIFATHDPNVYQRVNQIIDVTTL